MGPQRDQRGRRRQRDAHRGQSGVTGEQVRQERDDGEQGATDGRQAPTHPANGRGQRDIGAQDIGRRLDTPRGLRRGHHVLDRIELAGKMAGETIGQQTERLAGRRTVVARDADPGRGAPRVRAVTHEAAAATRMAGTGGKTCVTPGAARNIGLAGERAFVTQLHRPGDARWPPWRPHVSSPSPTMATALLSQRVRVAPQHPARTPRGRPASRRGRSAASTGEHPRSRDRRRAPLWLPLEQPVRFSRCAQRSALS